MTFDMSHLSWVLTANDLRAIAERVRDRHVSEIGIGSPQEAIVQATPVRY